MSTCPYHVVAESAEGWKLTGNTWERRFLPFTLACFESMEEAQQEVEVLKSGKGIQIRNIRVEVVHGHSS